MLTRLKGKLWKEKPHQSKQKVLIGFHEDEGVRICMQIFHDQENVFATAAANVKSHKCWMEKRPQQ